MALAAPGNRNCRPGWLLKKAHHLRHRESLYILVPDRHDCVTLPKAGVGGRAILHGVRHDNRFRIVLEQDQAGKGERWRGRIRHAIEPDAFVQIVEVERKVLQNAVADVASLGAR